MTCAWSRNAAAGGCVLALATLGCHSTATPTNVVDAVVQPLLAQNGLAPILEDDAVLCRRMAIDLTGIPPAGDEIDTICLHHSAEFLAVHFMSKPSGPHVPDGSAPYVWVNRRWWADSFQYQSTLNMDTTWYAYVRDLDDAVAELYAGQIGYDGFARRALASPAFARRFGIFESAHDLTLIASQAFRVFLGREALSSEAADFGNLWRAWSTQRMSSEDARVLYPDCPVLDGAFTCGHYELGLDGAACAGASQLGCQSILFGPAAVIPASPGFARWRDLGADQAALELPGRLLAAEREFAEAAVDRALTKYLGWWKTSTFRPDSDVPPVRDALVEKLIADGFDVRKLELEIVTSLLYTQRAAAIPGEPTARPLWAHGPTKPLYAEAWLDSLGLATGKPLGGCDFRFSDTSPIASEDAITIKYKFPAAPGITPLFYSDTAESLGGCPIAAAHGSPSGLVPAITRRVALAQVCPGAFVPPPGTTLPALVEMEYAGLGLRPSPTESAVWVKHLSNPSEGGCDAAAPAGCDLQQLADQLCASLFATAQANYY